MGRETVIVWGSDLRWEGWGFTDTMLAYNVRMDGKLFMRKLNEKFEWSLNCIEGWEGWKSEGKVQGNIE